MASEQPTHTYIDPTVASILDRPSKATETRSRSSSSAISDDSLDDLLSDPTTSALRAARLQQLKDEQARLNLLRTTGHGVFSTLEEKPAMDAVNASEHSVLFFTHPDFEVCLKMQRILRDLAELHIEARFVGVNAEEAKWLAAKMNVRVLPVVVGFKSGKEVGRLTGWDGVPGGERSGAAGIEEVLLGWKVLARRKFGDAVQAGSANSSKTGKLRSGGLVRDEDGEEDDWEWD